MTEGEPWYVHVIAWGIVALLAHYVFWPIAVWAGELLRVPLEHLETFLGLAG